MDTFVSVITQETRVAADYNPKQIAVRILDSSNKVVRSVTDWTELSGVQLELEAGTYTINASSNGLTVLNLVLTFLIMQVLHK